MAPIWSARGRASRFVVVCAVWLASAGEARADFVTPWIGGARPWEPDPFRNDFSLVSLTPRLETRLDGSRNVREEVVVDLESGTIVVRRRYGTTLIGPEWVDDRRTATLAAAQRAARKEWIDQVRRRALNPPVRAGDDQVTIDLPSVMGQQARLNLTGTERITFSGTSNRIDGGPTFESGDPSAFPDLDMKQELSVNLDGTIGEKIHVLVNHDSEVDTDLSNRIKLRYDGDEDEVVQKIEMGNTDLSLPGSEFLSFRKSQQGLFGAKLEGQLGRLDFTAIASKQEGQTASQTFVGRARRDSLIVKDTDFVKRKYYWVDQPDSVAVSAANDGVGVLPIAPGTFEVFLDDRIVTNDIRDGAALGFAYADPRTGAPADSIGVRRGFFHRLQVNVDYQVNLNTGTLVLERPLGREETVAIVYVRDDGIAIGDLSDADSLVLQLVAPPEIELYDDAKGFQAQRTLEQKNIYSLGARNIRPESFEMVIRRRASADGTQDEDTQTNADGSELEYVRILGLDYKGVSDAVPDLRVEPEFVDYEDGTITFPNITPFAPDSSAVNVIVSPASVPSGRSGDPVPLLDYNSDIYTLEPSDFLNRDKYQLEVKYTTPTPTYSLNRFNILEGSERVVLNGRTLTRGSDYDIDYDFGILTFRTADAGAADAEIQVDFEYVPLFGQAKESLVGLSGTYHFSPRILLSSSWLYFTRATPEERPKLGQEPSRILVGNLYGQMIANPGVMTSLVNAIPLVRSETESELQLQGEVALSLPNPNTKNEIYIDDMEGVEDSRELSITRGVWAPASEPAGPDTEGLDFTEVRPVPYNWYNPENVVRRRDVFPELADEREGQDFIQVLEFRARDEVEPDSTGWMGVMRNLSSTGEDYSEKKFLEIWVNDFGQHQGRMIFDMGEISEDFYVRTGADSLANKGRGFLDTEDVSPFDGELTVSQEDFGLDNVRGDDALNVPGDDGDDDFFFRRTATPDYSKINNYEGNSILDTEDLDHDNFLDEDNAYFSYVFDLADQPCNEVGSVCRQDNGNGWRLFQIPLDDGVPVGGVPRRRSIQYARLWFEGMTGGSGAKVQVASIKIVGAAWLEERLSSNDTVQPIPDDDLAGSLLVNVLNNKEDPGYFPPFDPGEDGNNEERREQTLVLDYRDLRSGTADVGVQGGAYKEILDTGDGSSQDFTQYESLSFYLRDGRYPRGGETVDPSQGTFFFRFGPDTTNFYEFSTTNLVGGAPGREWRELFVRLQEISELKLDPPSERRVVEGVEVDYRATVVEGDTLAVYGAPSLARVRRLTVGVKGDDPSRPTVSGEIWVNEIRLRSVKKEVGYASRLSGNARFADLATLNGGVRRVDSEYRRIEGDRAGQTTYSWNTRGDVKLDKFFEGLGVSLPVAGDYAYTEGTPRLAPNSDIELVNEEDKAAARSTNESRTISSRISRSRQSTNPFLRYSVDNLTLSAQDTQRDSKTPFLVSDDHTTSGSASYNLNPGQGKSFRLLNRFDVSYFPSVQLGMTGSTNLRKSADVNQDALGEQFLVSRAPTKTRDLSGRMSVQLDPIRSNTVSTNLSFEKTEDFDLKKTSSLFESFRDGSRELRRKHDARLSYRPAFLGWLRPSVSYDTNYTEDQSPAVQPPDATQRLRRVENSNAREFTASLNLRQIFKDQGPRETGRATTTGSRRRRSSQGRSWKDDEVEQRQSPPADESSAAEERENSGVPGERPSAADEGGDAVENDGEGAPAQPDEEEEAPPEEKKSRPSFGDLYRKFGGFARMFGDIRYSYRDSRSVRFDRVRARPSLLFQWGLDDFDKGLLDPGSTLIEDNTSNTYGSKLDTTFQPNSSLYLDTSYARTLTQSVRNGTRSQSLDTTFPDLSVNLDGLEGYGLLRRLTKSSSLNSSYRRQTRRSGTLPEGGETTESERNWYDRETIRSEFVPFLQWTASFNSGINTTVSHTRTNVTEESDFNTRVTRTETTSSAYRLNGRYSFSAPQGIQFLGKRLRFKSDLTLSLDMSRSEDKSVEAQIENSGQTTTTVRDHRKNIAVTPRAAYNFSRKVQGSLDIGYTKSKDLQRDRTETQVSVAVEAVIKF